MRINQNKIIKLQLIFCLFSTCSSILIAQEKERRNEIVDPMKYLPTLTFGEKGFLKVAEKNFPISIYFNQDQDGNADGKINVEDNIENLVLYSIGKNIYGTGRTGIENRGPNDQSPSIYFNYAETFSHNVYQYWYYYGENSHLENHEHDWESVFVFEKDTLPVIIQVTSFGKLVNYKWSDFKLDEGHIVLGVRRGDHSFTNRPKDGVAIRYNGEIHAQEGILLNGNNEHIPWTIYSSKKYIKNAIFFDETRTTKFYYGDIAYPRSGSEMDKGRKAPWRRRRWRKPRKFDQ